jgi:hypothetical protein
MTLDRHRYGDASNGHLASLVLMKVLHISASTQCSEGRYIELTVTKVVSCLVRYFLSEVLALNVNHDHCVTLK